MKVNRVYLGENGLAVKPEKLKKIYRGDENGLAELIYTAQFMSYSVPDAVDVLEDVEYQGMKCTVYRLRKSGILTLFDDALVWLCGGGANGGYVEDCGAGGGGGGYVSSGSLAVGEHVIAVASAGGVSKVDSSLTAGPGETPAGTDGGSGGSGGGGGGTMSFQGSGGKGAGKSTYPFGIASLNAHCAGGGGGVSQHYASTVNGQYTWIGTAGGSGGSNGGAGGDGIDKDLPQSGVGSTTYLQGGSGGTYGGGRGGMAPSGMGGSASYYGGGGGGAGAGDLGYGSGSFDGSPGSGYQGVVYILDYKGGVPA